MIILILATEQQDKLQRKLLQALKGCNELQEVMFSSDLLDFRERLFTTFRFVCETDFFAGWNKGIYIRKNQIDIYEARSQNGYAPGSNIRSIKIRKRQKGNYVEIDDEIVIHQVIDLIKSINTNKK